MGSLLYAITGEEKEEFQPTNINFGLFPPLETKARKREKRDLQVKRARKAFANWLSGYEPFTQTEQFVEQAASEISKNK